MSRDNPSGGTGIAAGFLDDCSSQDCTWPSALMIPATSSHKLEWQHSPYEDWTAAASSRHSSSNSGKVPSVAASRLAACPLKPLGGQTSALLQLLWSHQQVSCQQFKYITHALGHLPAALHEQLPLHIHWKLLLPLVMPLRGIPPLQGEVAVCRSSCLCATFWHVSMQPICSRARPLTTSWIDVLDW